MSKGLNFLTSNRVAFWLGVGASTDERLHSRGLTYKSSISLSGGLVLRAPESVRLGSLAQGGGPPASSTGRASFVTSFSRGDSSDGALSSNEE